MSGDINKKIHNIYYIDKDINCDRDRDQTNDSEHTRDKGIVTQFGGMGKFQAPDVAIEFGDAVKEAFHAPLAQVRNMSDNTKGIISNTGKVLQTSHPIIRSLNMVPCKIANFYQ